MKERPRKYCPLCGERVRHSTSRCPYCQHRILTTRRVLIYILIAMAAVIAIFLWLDYKNIEIFK